MTVLFYITVILHIIIICCIESVTCFALSSSDTNNNNINSSNNIISSNNSNKIENSKLHIQHQQQQTADRLSSTSLLSSSSSSLPFNLQDTESQQQQQQKESSSEFSTSLFSSVISLNKNNGKTVRYILHKNKNDLNDNTSVTSQQDTQQASQLTRNNNDITISTTTSIKKKNTNIILQLLQIRIKVLYENCISIVRSTFLPTGYPVTTPIGYLQYSIWSWIQDLTTQLRSVIATQRILEGIGVGNAYATSLSALLNFLMRDASGMVASLLFTSNFAYQFKTDIKRWRIFADIMVDIGITLEIIAVSLPKQYFLPIICCGTICKAICGVAAGSVGGAINLFWATGSDISDINAKFGAQHTVTASIGLVAAAIFAKTVSKNVQSSTTLYTLYSILTILHIYANTQCMKLIAFTSFNTIRLSIILNEFLQQLQEDTRQVERKTIPVLQLPTPQQITKVEPLFFFVPKTSTKSLSSSTIGNKKSSIPIQFGISFNTFQNLCNKSDNQIEQTYMSSLYSSTSSSTSSSSSNNNYVTNTDDYYLLSTGVTTSNKLTRIQQHKQQLCILVSLSEKCSPITQIQAFVHATILQRNIEEEQCNIKVSSSLSSKGDVQLDNTEELCQVELMTLKSLPQIWKLFYNSCTNAGWNLLASSELKTNGYSISFV